MVLLQCVEHISTLRGIDVLARLGIEFQFLFVEVFGIGWDWWGSVLFVSIRGRSYQPVDLVRWRCENARRHVGSTRRSYSYVQNEEEINRKRSLIRPERP
jgi:hypothetical protein